MGVILGRAGSFLEWPSCGSVSMASTTLMLPESRVTVRTGWDEGAIVGCVLTLVADLLDGGSMGVDRVLFFEDRSVSTSGRLSSSQ